MRESRIKRRTLIDIRVAIPTATPVGFPISGPIESVAGIKHSYTIDKAADSSQAGLSMCRVSRRCTRNAKNALAVGWHIRKQICMGGILVPGTHHVGPQTTT